MAAIDDRWVATGASPAPGSLTGYLTVRQAAEVLNMHFMSVYKLVQSGELPALKLGSRWKIDPVQLKSWMARHRGRRQWLVIGSDGPFVGRLRQLVSPGDQVRVVNFGALGTALGDAPDVVMIDTARDADAALAALAVVRGAASPPFTVLLVDGPCTEVITDALETGVVTLLSYRAPRAVVEQIETLLQWT